MNFCQPIILSCFSFFFFCYFIIFSFLFFVVFTMERGGGIYLHRLTRVKNIVNRTSN